MQLPPAKPKYDQKDENAVRALISEEINDVNNRVVELEEGSPGSFLFPHLPIAGADYNQTNENKARLLTSRALDSLEARITALEATPAEPEPEPETGPRTTLALFNLGNVEPNTLWGNFCLPDTCFSGSNGNSYVGSGTNFITYIRAITGLGLTPRCKLIIKVTGGGSDSVASGEGGNRLVDGYPKGSFVPQLWKEKYDLWYAGIAASATTLAEFKSAIGQEIVCILAADDYGGTRSSETANGYIRPVTFEELEEISAYHKSFFPDLPIMGRVNNTFHRQQAARAGNGSIWSNESSRRNGVRQYKYFDAGFGQFKWTTTSSEGFPDTYVRDQIQFGDDCGLGLIGGANILARGSGTGGTHSFTTTGASIGATTVPVSTLAKGIEKGKVITFTGGKTATLSETAFQRATSIKVTPLAAALISGDRCTIANFGCLDAACRGDCAMSYAEMEEIGLTWMTYVHPGPLHYPRAGKCFGFVPWAYLSNEACGTEHIDDPQTQASLQVVADKAYSTNRVDGHLNIRGDHANLW